VDVIASVFAFFADASSPESSSAFRFTVLAVAVEAMGGGAFERLFSAVLPPPLTPPLPPPPPWRPPRPPWEPFPLALLPPLDFEVLMVFFCNLVDVLLMNLSFLRFYLARRPL